MAAEQQESAGSFGRLFTDHPRSLGMTWAQHGAGRPRSALELIGAGAPA